MSTELSKAATVQDEWAAEDEIDLRKYINVLGRRWREIMVITLSVIVLTALGVFVFRFLSAPRFEATASAAIVRTQTDVKLDERFTTSSDQIAGQDVNSRRAALVGLVSSGAIADQVITELGDTLNEDERNPAFLLRMVSGELGLVNGRAGQSDLITVKATADTPEKAAAIANTWVNAYVQQVNRIYGQVPDEMLRTVDAELAQTKSAYDKAQAVLQSFLAGSQIETISRQLIEKRDTIQALQKGKADALQTYVTELVNSYQRIVQAYLDAQTNNQLLAFQKEQEGQRGLVSAYFDAYNAATVDTFNAQRTRDQALLRQSYDQWLQTTANLATARTLQQQLATGGEGAVSSTALALQWLKLQSVYNGVTSGTQYSQIADANSAAASAANRTNAQRPNAGDNLGSSQVLVTQAPPASSPPVMQVQLAAAPNATLATVKADADSVVRSLETQLTEMEEKIATLNQSLLSGDQFTDLGASVPTTSTLFSTIQAQYPNLFNSGAFSAISDAASAGSGLAVAGQDQAQTLFSMGGLESLPTTSAVDAPMAKAIDTLEAEVRDLQAQLETESARNLQVTQQRDLDWETYKALTSKQAELTLARAAANSEVRVGTLAVAPDEPLRGVSLVLSVALAGVVGLLLAVFVAFVLEYMGRPPLFKRAQPTT